MSDYERRINRLEAMLGPTVSIDVQRQAEHLAGLLGITPEELLADAAEIAATCPGVPGETTEAQAGRLADRLGISVDELLADIPRK